MLEQIRPMDIERRSFEIITELLGDRKLDPENELVIKRAIHTTADFDYADNLVFSDHAVTKGIEALREALAGKLSCLTGNSGVGKSSLLNRACPQLCLPVGEVSEKLGRGRHTTRHIELYSLGADTFVADTPGFSAFDTERMELVHKEQLQYAFPEFTPYLGQCQFPDCAHRKEPGCAVRKALAEGKIGQTRYDSYERLYELASQIKEWELK